MKKANILIEALLGLFIASFMIFNVYDLLTTQSSYDWTDLTQEISEECTVECLIEKHLH
jgi:hypothetical protein